MCFAKKLVITGVMNIVFQFSNVASLASIKEGFNIKWYKNASKLKFESKCGP